MGRRYRRKKSESLFTVISDVIQISSKLPWWGALLVGSFTYVLFATLLHGFIEHQIASQAGSQFHEIMEARFERLKNIFTWIGQTSFIASALVAIYKYFQTIPNRDEQSFIQIISRLLNRIFD
ncbi:hypothetical protein [Pseudoalteromonas sp. T1lg24]|uniref:hypothetical protein n=1 Tax=Pseudoalteromonas sp. T1lg24 TaxID=2077099 RepID=UPI000CF6F30E|nr:hypothetical protein [Pseudoalteromonas sp. T1lg24]